MGSRQEPPAGAEVLFDFGSKGQRLTVMSGGSAEMWDGWIMVEAHPFSGVIRTILTEDDVAQYRSALTEFTTSGSARFGGYRAPRIDLNREGDTIEVVVTPSGDDPWPTLKYLIFLNLELDANRVTFPNA